VVRTVLLDEPANLKLLLPRWQPLAPPLMNLYLLRQLFLLNTAE